MNQRVIRRPKLTTKSYNLNYFHLRNPLVIAWWSLTYPGFGHIALGSVAKGLFLFIGEVIINYKANVNMAIIYSFIGEFQKAKDVLDTQWLLVYTGVLFLAVWDSYRLTIEFNKFSILGDREDAPMIPLELGGISINGLEKRNPWVAFAWSILVPGLGQLYTAQTVKSIFLVIIGAAFIICSHTLQAIHYTFVGNFSQAQSVLDWQLALNVPSFFGFAVWDAYINSVEINKLFDKEQAKYFRKHFQNLNYSWPH